MGGSDLSCGGILTGAVSNLLDAAVRGQLTWGTVVLTALKAASSLLTVAVPVAAPFTAALGFLLDRLGAGANVGAEQLRICSSIYNQVRNSESMAFKPAERGTKRSAATATLGVAAYHLLGSQQKAAASTTARVLESINRSSLLNIAANQAAFVDDASWHDAIDAAGWMWAVAGTPNLGSSVRKQVASAYSTAARPTLRARMKAPAHIGGALDAWRSAFWSELAVTRSLWRAGIVSVEEVLALSVHFTRLGANRVDGGNGDASFGDEALPDMWDPGENCHSENPSYSAASALAVADVCIGLLDRP